MKAFTGLLKKKGDTLEYVNSKDEIKYQAFKKAVPDNMLVETYMEIQTDDGTLAQLAKIHALIRELCMHTGDTFEDMKLIIKKRAGLCVEKELDGSRFLYCKSFGDCSKDELSLAIQAIQEVSQLLEFPLWI
jgi:hypothetical protein